MEWIDSLINHAMAAIGQGSLAANVSLFLIVSLTEMGVPFPFIMDATVIITSFQNGILSPQVGQVFLVVFLGRQFGAGIIYWLTRLLGTAFIKWMQKRFPTLMSRLTSLETKFGNKAIWAIAIARISSLNTVASMASGALRLRYYKFAAGVALSALIFDGALIIIGSGAGAFLPHSSPTIIVIGIIVILALGWSGYYLFRPRCKKRLPDSSNSNGGK
jgi:membrane protein DedA with SNARE-associated domain